MSAYNNEQDGDCLSEIIMVTLVGATPLMLPVQNKHICIVTQKRNINEWLQLP